MSEVKKEYLVCQGEGCGRRFVRPPVLAPQGRRPSLCPECRGGQTRAVRAAKGGKK